MSGIHIVLSAQASALILKIIAHHKYALLGVYSNTLAILVALGLNFLIYNLSGYNLSILVLISIPLIWLSLAFFEAVKQGYQISKNAKEVLSESTFKKFEMAHASDTVINIITNDDYISANNFLSGRKTNVWHFKADNVTDFAFGISDHYLWDAVSLVPDKNSDSRAFISAAYNPVSKDFYDVAQIAKDALQYYSTDLPGIPFPYPSFTVFNGGGGMEFPMIINDESNTTLAGTVGLTSHEAAHTYFPFYMGINEKKYAWMDEGLAVMLPIKFQSRVEGNDPLGRNVKSYAAFAGEEMDMPPIIPSNLLRGPSYRVASYQRPGIAYHYLQDFLGRDIFPSKESLSP